MKIKRDQRPSEKRIYRKDPLGAPDGPEINFVMFPIQFITILTQLLISLNFHWNQWYLLPSLALRVRCRVFTLEVFFNFSPHERATREERSGET